MRIGIDASRYNSKNPTGIELYTNYLLDHLIPILGRDHTNEVILYTNGKKDFAFSLPFNCSEKIIKRHRLWTVLGLSKEMLFNKPDVLFIPSHTFPFFAPKKAYITIHDLGFMHLELNDCYSEKEKKMQVYQAKRALEISKKIIVPSNSTKEDLIRFFRCDENKIEVVYHGGPDWMKELSIGSFSVDKKNELYGKFGLREGELFMLYVGRIEFKKNLIKLIEGFKRFSGEFLNWKLVLAGGDGFGASEIKELVGELGLSDQVLFTGYVNNEEKAFLYKFCRNVVYPSKFEGFGFNVLEAFMFKKPLICSNRGSLKEIAGEGNAVFVNPDKVEEISVSMKRMAIDPMITNKVLINSEHRIKAFDWEKAANETAKVILEEIS